MTLSLVVALTPPSTITLVSAHMSSSLSKVYRRRSASIPFRSLNALTSRSHDRGTGMPFVVLPTRNSKRGSAVRKARRLSESTNSTLIIASRFMLNLDTSGALCCPYTQWDRARRSCCRYEGWPTGANRVLRSYEKYSSCSSAAVKMWCTQTRRKISKRMSRSARL